MLEREHIEDTINNMLIDINYIKFSIYTNSKRLKN